MGKDVETLKIEKRRKKARIVAVRLGHQPTPFQLKQLKHPPHYSIFCKLCLASGKMDIETLEIAGKIFEKHCTKQKTSVRYNTLV